ncbi:MAG TPA: hypothetical protein VGE07_12410 [Herpetosiphonaceae bacterium]
MERQQAIELAEHWFRNSLRCRGGLRTSAEIGPSGRWQIDIESEDGSEAVVLHIHADGKVGDEIVYLQVFNRN